jgi:hypothetical protein
MKLFLMLTLFISAANAAFIGGTLQNKKSNAQLGISCANSDCSEAQFLLDNGTLFENMFLDLADQYDAHYKFNVITTVASTSRPIFPYPLYLINMRRVTKKLRKAFPMMLDKNQLNKSVEMGDKNFKAVLEAIKNF